jgi:hypothetical protein
MMVNHDYFDFLCALAASDELTEPERVELHDHSLKCVSCRNRILEMTRMNAYLLLSHAFTSRRGRLPEGMRERFIARAIEQGVPLKSPATAGLGALGLASALFIILLVTAGAIRSGPFSITVADNGHFDTGSKPLHATKPALSDLRQGSGGRRSYAKPKSVLVLRNLDPSTNSHGKKPRGALPDHLDIFQNHYFSGGLSSPHYTLATMPVDVGRLSSLPYMPSRLRLAVPPALIRDSALQLLADSGQSTPQLMTFPSGFTFATPPPPGMHPALDNDPSRMPSILELRGTPLKFHFVENVTQ